MKTLELNHVAIHVEDVERTCEFYSNVMQLQALPRPAFDFPGAWYLLGEVQELHIIGNRDEQVNGHPRGNHFALMVDDIDAWETHLDALGVEHYPRRVRPDGPNNYSCMTLMVIRLNSASLLHPPNNLKALDLRTLWN